MPCAFACTSVRRLLATLRAVLCDLCACMDAVSHWAQGINGAGKTTTLKALSGDLVPTTGTATIAGFDVITEQLKLRRLLGYVYQLVVPHSCGARCAVAAHVTGGSVAALRSLLKRAHRDPQCADSLCEWRHMDVAMPTPV